MVGDIVKACRRNAKKKRVLRVSPDKWDMDVQNPDNLEVITLAYPGNYDLIERGKERNVGPIK